MISVAESVQKAQYKLSFKLEYNESQINVVYQKAREDFLRLQNNLYGGNLPPHYTVTKALNNRLWHKETFYQNPNLILKPLDDFHMCIMTYLNTFLSQTTIWPKRNDEQNLIIIDQIKEKVAQTLKDEIRMIFLNPRPVDVESQNYFWNDEWHECHSYSGSKSDKKRREKMMEIFHRFVPQVEILFHKETEYWIRFIQRKLTQAIDELNNA